MHVPKKSMPVLLEVLLVRLQHTIKPRQQLLGTVIRVHDDGSEVITRMSAQNLKHPIAYH